MSEEFVINTKDAVKNVKPAAAKLFKLLPEGHPDLSLVSKAFDFTNPPTDANVFASTLTDTARAYKALGLAAIQCGFTYRVFVMGVDDQYVAFFNPKIVPDMHLDEWTNDGGFSLQPNRYEIDQEGCLSFPGLFLNINRLIDITVSYDDYLGESHVTRLSGLSARIFQHELDHLDGILFTKKCKPLALSFAKKKRLKRYKVK